ncbi:MAG: Mpo1-like protein [Inhella sp.]
MNPLTWITRFAREHRDPRNIALHCWGVPMVLGGVLMLLLEPVRALSWAAALLLSGGLLQVLGHVYEGRRPRHGWRAGLAAPLFVGLQGLHRLGLAERSWQQVERAAGPRRLRDLAQPA